MNKNVISSGNSTSSELAKKMGIGCLIAAAIFLFNPVINVVDLLPDFFGYLLLIKGLSKWADLCPGIADAVQGLSKLKWFMLLKMFAMVLVPLVDDTYVLVLTFGFAVIELIYVIPAIRRIFDGFEYFGTRFNGKSIYINYKNVQTITFIFFYSKIILPIIPELCSLSDYEYSGYVTSGVQVNFASYKGVLLIVGLFLTMLIGIMWIINIIPYFKRIGRETGFLSVIYEQYCHEISNNFGLTFRRALSSLLWVISAGFILLINFWIDGINVIPNFIGGIFLIIAAVKITKISNASKLMTRISITFTILSAISYTVSLIFSIIYELRSIQFDFKAYDLYNVTRILYIFEYALMFVTVFLIFRELRKLTAKHLGPDPGLTDRRLIDIYTNQKKEFDHKLIMGLIGFVISFALNIIYLIFRAEFDQSFKEFWILAFISSGAWWIYMKSSFSQLYDQIEYKFL
jgi:hypothetical protein